MPKKTRKMKQRAAMRRSYQPVESEREQTGLAEPEDSVVRMRQTTPSSRATTPLTFDYSHIYSDLRRIALFAGFFFAVLIVLSFVIK